MTPEPPADDPVPVQRRVLREIRTGVVVILVAVAVLVGAFVVRVIDTDNTAEEFRQRDEAVSHVVEELRAEQQRLDDLIAAEAVEEEREAAQLCLNSHARAGALADVLHRIAPEHEEAIARDYPAPTCSVAEAQAVLAADPELPPPSDAG